MQQQVLVHGAPLPTEVIPISAEELTFVTIEYGRRTFRFSVRGVDAPYEVSYRHEFPEWDPETGQMRHAWFPIDEQDASRGVLLQQYVYPQLLELHCSAHAIEWVVSGTG